MGDSARTRRVAERIKVIVAEHLEYKLKDERLAFVTVTDVRVTGDLQHATVFYTVFGDEEQRETAAKALQAAKGRIRSALGQLGIRLTPSVEFVADALPEGAAHLESLLADTRARDARLAQEAEGKVPAGDPDPYRKPAAETSPDE